MVLFFAPDKIYLKENMFLFREYDLSYCHMPKTGSTTVVNHFQQVYEGYRTEEEEAEVVGGQVFLAFAYLTGWHCDVAIGGAILIYLFL